MVDPALLMLVAGVSLGLTFASYARLFGIFLAVMLSPRGSSSTHMRCSMTWRTA